MLRSIFAANRPLARPPRRPRLAPSALAVAALVGLGAQAVASPYVWTSGGFVPGVTAPSPLPVGEELLISGAPTKSFLNVVFENLGSVLWSAGALTMGGGASVSNAGLWDIAGDLAMSYSGGGATTFTNTGVLRRSVGEGVASFGSSSFGFVNSSEVQAASGILRLGGVNSFLAGSSFSGAGSVEVSSGSTWTGAFQSANLRWTSATQTGNAAVLNGQVEWAGSAGLAGTWTVADGAVLTATGAGAKTLSGAGTVLTIDGTLAWAGSGNLSMGSSAQLINTGLVDLQTVGGNFSYSGGGATTFTNAGTLRNSSGDLVTVGNSFFGFVNQGTIEATENSVLRLGGTNSFQDGSVFAGTGSVEVTSSSSWSGGSQSANLRWTGGTQSGSDAVLGGQVEWAGTTALAGTWNVADAATLTATGAGAKILSGAGTALTIEGTLAWAGTGSLSMGSGAQLTNTGLVDIQTASSFTYSGGGAVRFDNAGTMRVSAPVAASVGVASSFVFSNTGVIDVREGATLTLQNAFGNDGSITGDGTVVVGGSGLLNRGTVAPGSFGVGTLALIGAYTQAAEGFLAVDLTDLSSFDLFTISGTATLAGTLALNCLGDCSFAVGDSLTILQSGGVLSGSFASVTLSGFATGAFDVIYDLAGSQVRLLVTEAVTPVPEPGTWALWLAGLGAVGGMVRRRRELRP
jgi:hypothetical protein